MELAALALQQASLQTNIALALIKNNAQTEQALVNMIAQTVQSSPSGGRGKNIDISV
ncbi:MAG: hypothetical protein V1721_00490 [Pseudomonadota bacterium]